MAGLDDEHQCTRCLEVLEYLIDPKQLPCHHVYCSVCLEAVVKTADNGLEIECSYCGCGKTHNFPDLAALDTVNSKRPDGAAEEENPSEHSDDIYKPSCSKCDSSAVCYCVDCGERYCSTDEDQHNKWYRPPKKHKLISIAVYLNAPGLYIKPKCPTHLESIAVSCQKCCKMCCSRCTTAENDCTGKSRHNYQSLFDIEKLLKHQFNQLFEKCTGKLSELAKLEESTWQKLDDEKENYEDMRKTIENLAQAKIEQINEEKESILQQIDGAEEMICENVENYLDDIRADRERLEQRLLSCRQFIRENSVTEIIAQKEGRYTQLEKMSVSTKGQDLHLLQYSLEATESSRRALKIEFLPSKLQLEICSEHRVSGTCRSVSSSHKSMDGKSCIYLSTRKGVELFNLDTPMIRQRLPTISGYIQSICTAPSDRLFILQARNSGSQQGRVIVETNQALTKEPSNVFEFEISRDVATYMTYLKNDTLLVTNREKRCVYALNTNDNFSSKTVNLPDEPRVVHAHPDGSFLLTTENDSLYKFELLDSGDVRVFWICENLPSAYGISVKDNGLIIVCSRYKGNIYLLTPQGVLFQTIFDDHLNHVVGGMCIVGDVLFLPCWEHEQFLRCLLR